MARVAADWPELQRYADLIAEAEREVVGQHETDMGGLGGERLGQKCGDITAPATSEAQQWSGWGTALKPALEPITVARKPLIGTVAANVLEHGTGALNVDGCRVGAEARPVMVRTETVVSATAMSGQSTGATSSGELTTAGRWPANLIHDGSEEPAALLGTAARFFYCAKASRSDRGDGNNHPTVKPTDLMRYLCRLVTPPGGTVLDPFMGSGSTGKAAALEGFHFLGIEREAQYLDIARARIRAVVDAAPLFAGKP
jgi:site-specific DNA-methyltransferase (adenine-specific)